MHLNLTRPIIFFDFESTGTNPQTDRIVQFCFVKHYPDHDGLDMISEYVNPGIEISPAATEVHGLTNEFVSQFKGFDAYAPMVAKWLEGCDLAGFGIKHFDIPLLFNELLRCGIEWDYTQHRIIDIGNIYKRQIPRDLTSAYLFYVQRSFEGAHDAVMDTYATREVFLNQVKVHSDLPKDIDALALYSNFDKPVVDLSGKFTTNDQGEIVFNFGNKRGEKAKDNPSYLYWMLDRDFSQDVKIICRRILEESSPVSAINLDELPW